MSLLHETHLPRLKALSLDTQQRKSSRPKTPVGKYIQQSLKRMEAGCYLDNRLDIDGGIGDYKMSIFRLKDRKKRIRQIPTIFTNTFISKVEKIAPQSKADFMKIINTPNEEYLAKVEALQQLKRQQNPRVYVKPIYESCEGDHLFYNYIPTYQKQKWFSTVDNSPKTDKLPSSKNPQLPIKPILTKNKKKSDRTHFFRFLDKSLLYSSNLSNINQTN